jgi:hypothetical protein
MPSAVQAASLGVGQPATRDLVLRSVEEGAAGSASVRPAARGCVVVAQRWSSPDRGCPPAWHSVAISLKVHANCLDTDDGVANDRIAAALDGVPGSGRLDRIPNDGERSSSGVCGPDADEDSAGDLDHGKAAGGGLA